MSKDPVTGLYYPFYKIVSWDWEKDEQKEAGGEYNPFVLLRTQEKEDSVKAFKKVRVSSDRLQVELLEEHEEEVRTLAQKVSTEDGPYTEWFS